MAPNPHVRNIRIFEPEIDLGNVDKAKTARRGVSKKRPKHPGEGLLDEDELDVEIPPESSQADADLPSSVTSRAREAATPEVFATDKGLPEVPPSSSEVESSERFSGHVIGEAPEAVDAISEDFPEPVDI